MRPAIPVQNLATQDSNLRPLARSNADEKSERATAIRNDALEQRVKARATEVIEQRRKAEFEAAIEQARRELSGV
jgi:hypothetical protein